MKLIRHGSINKEKTGIVSGDTYYDTSAFGEDYNETFFETGGLERLKVFVEKNTGGLPVLPAGVRLGSPVARPSKSVCIGLNCVEHPPRPGGSTAAAPRIFLQ